MRLLTISAVVAIALASLVSCQAVQILGSRQWTSDSDFNQGVLNRVTHDVVHNELQLLPSMSPRPYIWVPNSGDCTISKIDIYTRKELARYRVNPRGTSGSPSRTTVDQDGNCYVGCRYDGTVVKVGLPENGQGVGWIDRDHDSQCDTSTDLNNDGNITGDELKPFGQDECVLYEVLLKNGEEGVYEPGTLPWNKYDNSYSAPRSLAVDKDNNIWVGCYHTGNFYYLEGDSGRILRKFTIPGHHAYGAVMDRNGIIWSSGADTGQFARIDPSTEPPTVNVLYPGHFCYGVGTDQLGHVFVSGWDSCRLSCYDTVTSQQLWQFYDYRIANARGVACDLYNNIWVVSSANNKVVVYDQGQNYLFDYSVGYEPTGVARDAQGSMWVVDNADTSIWKIIPDPDQIYEKVMDGTGGHYGYSDMGGMAIWDNTKWTGTWTVTWDTGIVDASWGVLNWNDTIPADTYIKVKVRSSTNNVNWSAWEQVYKNLPVSTIPDGRYLQIQAMLHSDVQGVSPALHDITASYVNSFLVSPRNVSVPENSTANFLVKLKANPISTVYGTISKLAGGDPDLSLQSSSTLTFGPSNWNNWQTATLRAAEDVDSHNGTATFRLTSSALKFQEVYATEVDNDLPQFVIAWGSYGPNGGQFDHPMDVCADPYGNVFVADTQNHRVQKFTSTGGFLQQWGARGSGNGQFEQPCGICSDRQGNIFVADTYNNRIQVFRNNGVFVCTMTGHNLPWGICSGPDDSIFLADTYYHHVDKYIPYDNDNDGLYDQWDGSGSFGGQGVDNGQFRYPEGVCTDNIGNIYVVDTYNNRIQKFDSYNTFKTTFGAYGTLGGQFRYPKGASIDQSTGDLYVSNMYNHRMDLFFNGTFQASWGTYGTANGQFASPGGISAGPAGNIYIADTDNNRIQKYFRQPISIRDLPDGTPVTFGPVYVTAFFDPLDMVFVENGDRTFGIRVNTAQQWLYVSEEVNVSGLLGTDTATGERYIQADAGYPRETYGNDQTIVPLGMRNEWIRTTAQSHTAIGTEGYPFYSAGLLVHTWGKVMSTTPSGNYFTIRDGSRIISYPDDNAEVEEIYLNVVVPSGMWMPSVGDYVKVTGVSSRMAGNQAAIRVRDWPDVQTCTGWQSFGNALTTGQNYLALPGIPYNWAPEAVWVACPGQPGLELSGYLTRYHPERQRWYYHMECDGFGNGIMGEGYGLYVPPGGATSYCYSNVPVSEDVDQIVFLPRGSNPQWAFSLIGNPYDDAVTWAGILVVDGTQIKSLPDAISSGWIWAVQEWNGSSWVNVNLNWWMFSGKAYKVFPKRSKLALVLPTSARER